MCQTSAASELPLPGGSFDRSASATWASADSPSVLYRTYSSSIDFTVSRIERFSFRAA
jgi:hypothetical protein